MVPTPTLTCGAPPLIAVCGAAIAGGARRPQLISLPLAGQAVERRPGLLGRRLGPLHLRVALAQRLLGQVRALARRLGVLEDAWRGAPTPAARLREPLGGACCARCLLRRLLRLTLGPGRRVLRLLGLGPLPVPGLLRTLSRPDRVVEGPRRLLRGLLEARASLGRGLRLRIR